MHAEIYFKQWHAVTEIYCAVSEICKLKQRYLKGAVSNRARSQFGPEKSKVFKMCSKCVPTDQALMLESIISLTLTMLIMVCSSTRTVNGHYHSTFMIKLQKSLACITIGTRLSYRIVEQVPILFQPLCINDQQQLYQSVHTLAQTYTAKDIPHQRSQDTSCEWQVL